jgi:hypothetical protein
MSRPSNFAAPLAELEQGDKVEEDGTVGDWIRLKSKSGRPGYIFGEDAKEVN